MSRQPGPVRLREVIAPRFWPLWAGLGLLRLLIHLPFGAQRGLGRLAGRLMRRLAPRRAKIVRANIRHCYPTYSPAEVDRLSRAHFESLGIALFETAQCWWGSTERLQHQLKAIHGLEHARAAAAAGQGVILLSAHFTTLEISGRLLVQHLPFAPIYRRMNNPLLEYVTQKGRSKGTQGAIPKDNIKGMIRHLRDGQPIWFASDQQRQGSNSALVSFMGHPAHSAIGTSQIARMGKAAVIPFFAHRSDGGYVLELGPPLENFPSADPIADTERYHRLIEAQIAHHPEQYLWAHRRFKRAPGAPDYKA